MLLVAPAVDVEVNAAGAAGAVVIAVAFHLQVALPAAFHLLPVAIGYVLQSCRRESRGAYIRLSSRTRLLCLGICTWIFRLTTCLGVCFSCAMR